MKFKFSVSCKLISECRDSCAPALCQYFLFSVASLTPKTIFWILRIISLEVVILVSIEPCFRINIWSRSTLVSKSKNFSFFPIPLLSPLPEPLLDDKPPEAVADESYTKTAHNSNDPKLCLWLGRITFLFSAAVGVFMVDAFRNRALIRHNLLCSAIRVGQGDFEWSTCVDVMC